MRGSLFLPSFLPSAKDGSANRPGPRPPLPTLLVEEGLWSLCSGLFPAVFATCRVCSAMHPQKTPNSSPHPGLIPRPLWQILSTSPNTFPMWNLHPVAALCKKATTEYDTVQDHSTEAFVGGGRDYGISPPVSWGSNTTVM